MGWTGPLTPYKAGLICLSLLVWRDVPDFKTCTENTSVSDRDSVRIGTQKYRVRNLLEGLNYTEESHNYCFIVEI